jgi:signal peptidase I
MEQHNLPVINLKQLIKKRGWIDIPSSGDSMYPLIKEGDICRFQHILYPEKLKKGEIILFVTPEGNLVGHRCYRRLIKNGRLYIECKGDTNFIQDPLVEQSQLVGKLVQIKKRRMTLKSEGFLFQIWASIVYRMPALPRYCKRVFYFKKE